MSVATYWRLGTAADHNGSMEPDREKMIAFLSGFRMFRDIAQNLGRPHYRTAWARNTWTYMQHVSSFCQLLKMVSMWWQNALQQTMIAMSSWFRSNLLTLNYDKTHFLQFLTTHKNEMQQQIATSNSLITNINSTRFLGLKIDSTLTWRKHVTELTPKLNKACYVIRTLVFLRSPEILLCHMVSYFGEIPIPVLMFLRSKTE